MCGFLNSFVLIAVCIDFSTVFACWPPLIAICVFWGASPAFDARCMLFLIGFADRPRLVAMCMFVLSCLVVDLMLHALFFCSVSQTSHHYCRVREIGGQRARPREDLRYCSCGIVVGMNRKCHKTTQP